MNRVLYLACLWAFLALPPVLLSIRAFRSKRMPWWLVFGLIAGVGWLLVNGTVHFYYASFDDILCPYGDHVPADLLESRCADGAKLCFALFLGWAYGLVYSMPWLLIYGATQWGCWLRRRG